MNAESREAVFAELRKKGIKASKVVAADGSKANGEIHGVRKRVLVASVVGAALLAGAVAFFLGGRGIQDLPITQFNDTTHPRVKALLPEPIAKTNAPVVRFVPDSDSSVEC